MDISYLKFSPPTFLHLSFLINTPILLILFIIFAIVYLIASGILMYHWTEYGMGNPGIHVARVLFLFVSIFLFVSAGLALSYF